MNSNNTFELRDQEVPFKNNHNCADARFVVPKSLMLKTRDFWVVMFSSRLLIRSVSKEHAAFTFKDQGVFLEFLNP